MTSRIKFSSESSFMEKSVVGQQPELKASANCRSEKKGPKVPIRQNGRTGSALVFLCLSIDRKVTVNLEVQGALKKWEQNRA